MIPITWRSVGIDGLFPVVEADLQVAPMGPELTQLSINARYTPPLGPIGTIVDRALMHRLAEAVIRDFLHRVAKRITGAEEPADPWVARPAAATSE